MDAKAVSEGTRTKNRTTVERASERERVITRTINGPARLVWEAWTKPEIFKRWWVPKASAMSLLSCELDVRVGGKYRLVFDFGGSKTMAFFGTYTGSRRGHRRRNRQRCARIRSTRRASRRAMTACDGITRFYRAD
jgi:hypothetical protein